MSGESGAVSRRIDADFARLEGGACFEIEVTGHSLSVRREDGQLIGVRHRGDSVTVGPHEQNEEFVRKMMAWKGYEEVSPDVPPFDYEPAEEESSNDEEGSEPTGEQTLLTDGGRDVAALYGDVEIPPEDIDYAVENALWVARSAITCRTSTALDYLEVFERQLVTHWVELEKIHWTEEETTEQAKLVTDGGRDVSETEILHAFADCGVESEALATYGNVTRVGINPRENWASDVVKADATRLPFPDDTFAFGLFHPLCTKWAEMTSISGNPDDHPDQIDDARAEAKRVCEHWVIENVPRAPLRDPVVLDGKMFGLPIQYERAFETSFDVQQPPRQQALDTETSTFFYSGKDTSWWRSVKGVAGDYPKEHVAKNCLPLAYVHWLARQWLEVTGRAEGVTDYSDYDKRKTAERRREENQALTVFTDGGSSD